MPTEKKKTPTENSKVVERVQGFGIREIRPGYFFVQARRRGLKVAQGFSSLEAARLQCNAWATALVNEGLSAFDLTPEQRLDATRALAMLGDRASLVAAAHTWLRMNPGLEAVTVSTLFEKHVADIAARNRRQKTIQTRRQFLQRFAKDFGTRAASSVTTAEIEEWLKLRIPDRSFNTVRFCLHVAYEFALKQRFVDSNPVAPIERKQYEHSEPTFWPVDQIAAVLRASAKRDADNAERQSKWKEPGEPWIPLTPNLALCAFGGLRPVEAERLDWANVNFDAKVIRVPAAISKTKRGRIVPMEKTLTAWLLPYRKATGPVSPTAITIRRGRKVVLKRLKMKTQWPQDILRHSFATYWMALRSHEGRLAEMMGNSPGIVQRHYKGLTTRSEGARYFRILPSATGKILPLKTVAA